MSLFLTLRESIFRYTLQSCPKRVFEGCKFADGVVSIVADVQYRQVSNISRTLVSNKILDHSDAVGASPVGAAPTTSSFST